MYNVVKWRHMNHNFKHKINLAGSDWTQGFLRQNAELSVIKSEPTTARRFLVFEKIGIRHIYRDCCWDVQVWNLPYLQCWWKMFVCTIICFCQKQVGIATSHEQRCITPSWHSPWKYPCALNIRVCEWRSVHSQDWGFRLRCSVFEYVKLIHSHFLDLIFS
jgi:hypothetical protein